MQAADDSKRTDSPAEHYALSEIVSLVNNILDPSRRVHEGIR